MTHFKPYAELVVSYDAAEDLHVIETVSGRAVGTAQFDDADDAQRFVECWNACRHIAFPAAHIQASADRIELLEELRKSAWATACELQSELDALRVKAG